MVMQSQDNGREGVNWFYMWSQHLLCTCEVSTAVQAAHSMEKTRRSEANLRKGKAGHGVTA